MDYPVITLGGVPIPPEAGAPDQSMEPLFGATVIRMSDGAGVKLTHWDGKLSGTLTGSGLVPVGLDALDYRSSLEMQAIQPISIAQDSPAFTLPKAPRTDKEPWALALVEGRWMPTPCVRAGLVVTVTERPAATLYMVQFMPRFNVFADPPSTSMNAAHGWTLNWQEV
ncbi:TPA: hypothetical protein NU583_005684 [Pseudomonas aeruginosa]|uniref:hypothetical protein n=1 Tax=Pseudomonas aeruginosa TaxID=287 RepID=UPI000D001696|nr:hypothetical protein [Pseudomonas aeruginosa]HCF1748382.1 hypothetical protein [Pseudomonas aeruginosa]HCJ6297085.1 hypothetical protein [Pseudomonas aeruginosa]